MNKHERNSFYKYMDEIIPTMDKIDQKKLEFARSFILNNIEIDDAEDDPLVVISPMRYKVLIYVIFSIVLDYEGMKQNPDEQSSKLSGLGDLTFQKIKIPDKMGMQEKFTSLEVQDIFLVEELTPEDVEFIEQFLEKTNVDLESGTKFFIISKNQIIYLLRKIMRDYRTFLSTGNKSEE